MKSALVGVRMTLDNSLYGRSDFIVKSNMPTKYIRKGNTFILSKNCHVLLTNLVESEFIEDESIYM